MRFGEYDLMTVAAAGVQMTCDYIREPWLARIHHWEKYENYQIRAQPCARHGREVGCACVIFTTTDDGDSAQLACSCVSLQSCRISAFGNKPLWNFSSIGGIIRRTLERTSFVAEDIFRPDSWGDIARDLCDERMKVEAETLQGIEMYLWVAGCWSDQISFTQKVPLVDRKRKICEMTQLLKKESQDSRLDFIWPDSNRSESMRYCQLGVTTYDVTFMSFTLNSRCFVQ